jgi:hypothetical protein
MYRILIALWLGRKVQIGLLKRLAGLKTARGADRVFEELRNELHGEG